MNQQQQKEINKDPVISKDPIINEDIMNEDWPILLNELELNRFSLKNKKGIKKEGATSTVEESSNLSQNKTVKTLSTDKLMGEFLKEKILEDREGFKNSNLSLTEIEQLLKRDEVPNKNISSNKNINANQNLSANIKTNRELPIQERVELEKNTENSEESKQLTKLVAKGLGKVFMDKTVKLLTPLKFLFLNFHRIIIGMIQIIIPILLTWGAIDYVEIIGRILNKETEYIKYLYTAIFYFSFLFVSLTIQIACSGILNVFKMILNNLAVEAKK